jgi:hypothetical protein
MNSIKLLKKDRKGKKGAIRFDLKKRIYYFIINIYGYEILKLKPKKKLKHKDEY